MTTANPILSKEEKGNFSTELACMADSLKGIERVSTSGDDTTLQLLVAGLDIYARRLYLISERLMEVSEIKETA